MATKAVSVVTDKDIFYYVWDQMVKQNFKATNGYWDEDQGEYVWDTDPHYYSFDENDKVVARCAIGFIIEEEYYSREMENNVVYENHIINAIISSNEMWNFTLRSKAMVLVLQHIHDGLECEDWEYAFRFWQSAFNDEGDFIGADYFINFEKINEPFSDGWLSGIQVRENYDKISWLSGIQVRENYDKVSLNPASPEYAFMAKFIREHTSNSMKNDITLWEQFVYVTSTHIKVGAFKERVKQNAMCQDKKEEVDYVPQKLDNKVFDKIAEKILIHTA
jgi:hypothetical protein